MLSEIRERGMQVGVADLLRAIQYLPVGLSIIDRDLQFKFWNDTFCQCLDFPASLMQPGVLLEDLFRFNALRGEFGPGDPETQVRERIGLARQFVPHRFRRTRANGTVLQVTGRPMSDEQGRVVGFVTIYEDVTTEGAPAARTGAGRTSSCCRPMKTCGAPSLTTARWKRTAPNTTSWRCAMP
ncbi:PAS domain-containing protein [Massilia eburnea]|uniref:PAS domain-containing protein n=1 Tax=Massilia eburnea TaxID=1776165 RepID=UPI003D6BBA36